MSPSPAAACVLDTRFGADYIMSVPMTSRALLKTIVGLSPAPRCGLWLGNPHPDSWPGLHRYFGTSTEEELRRKLGDVYRWISPSFVESTFRSPAARVARAQRANQGAPTASPASRGGE